jgi:hypothetical protein
MIISPSMGLAQGYAPGEIIVKMKGKALLKSLAISNKLQVTGKLGEASQGMGMNLHHLSLKPGNDLAEVVAELNQDPNVEYAEPNFLLGKFSTEQSPQRLSAADVEVMANASGSNMVMTSAAIHLEEAWSQGSSPSGPEVVVAVIDTGLDINHSVFSSTGAVWTNSAEIPGNGVDDDGNGYIDDIHGWNFYANTNNPYDDDGHGTHVSGIILGVTQNIIGSGLPAARIRIMPLKFLDGSGSGTTTDAIRAIYYAVNNGAKILNNSWGGGNYSSALHEAIAYAYTHEVFFPAAAGNAGGNNDSQPMYPANYSVPNVMSVAATNSWDYLASFSNFGSHSVHMGSPGVSILSTFPGNTFGYSSGTSMATPFIAGVAALVAMEADRITGYQIKEIIAGGGDTIGSLSGKTISSKRLNAEGAVLQAKASNNLPSQPNYDLTLDSSDRELASMIGSGGAGCGLVGKLRSSGGGRGSGGPSERLPFSVVALIITLLVAPAGLVAWLRTRKMDGRDQRRFDRFLIDSQVRVKLDGRELVGSVSCISLGGARLDINEMLQKGGAIKMTITGPDGQEQVDVDGRVVWSEDNQSYGVQFQDTSESALSLISNWTRRLVREGN